MSISLVWVIAHFAFVITSLITERAVFQWLFFMYAVPVSSIIWLVFNSVWFNPRHNYFIISILVWSLLVAIHSSFLIAGIHIGLIYLLGIAGQIVIILWSCIKK